jgi:ATP-dependent DNA ligase
LPGSLTGRSVEQHHGITRAYGDSALTFWSPWNRLTSLQLNQVSLPQFTPMPLARLPEPFDHPHWVFELKYDGFRSLAYVERGRVRLASRNASTFKTFPELTAAIGPALACKDAVLDGEIVHLGSDGKPQFYTLMRRHGAQHFSRVRSSLAERPGCARLATP